MRVNPYIEPLLSNATELLNRPPSDAAELESRWAAYGMPVDPHPTSADMTTVRDFLGRWAAVIDAPDAAGRVELVNRLLRQFTAHPSITDHDGSGWHLHYRDPDASFGLTLAGATSAAAAQFLCERGMHRLGRCADAGCGRAFVDRSRPGRQRYCSPNCANRDAVRRHRSARR